MVTKVSKELLNTGTSSGMVPLWETLLMNGSSTKASNYELQSTDRGLLIDFTSGTWVLSTALGVLSVGFAFAVRNSGMGVITINPYSGELIDGEISIDLAPGDSCIVVADATASGRKTVGRTVVTVPEVPFASRTWTDVITTPGRTAGSIYQNNSGYPLLVSVAVYHASGGNSYAYVDDVTPPTMAVATSGIGAVAAVFTLFFLVPPGHYYKVTPASSISTWHELV